MITQKLLMKLVCSWIKTVSLQGLKTFVSIYYQLPLNCCVQWLLKMHHKIRHKCLTTSFNQWVISFLASFDMITIDTFEPTEWEMHDATSSHEPSIFIFWQNMVKQRNNKDDCFCSFKGSLKRKSDTSQQWKHYMTSLECKSVANFFWKIKFRQNLFLQKIRTFQKLEN